MTSLSYGSLRTGFDRDPERGENDFTPVPTHPNVAVQAAVNVATNPNPVQTSWSDLVDPLTMFD